MVQTGSNLNVLGTIPRLLVGEKERIQRVAYPAIRRGSVALFTPNRRKKTSSGPDLSCPYEKERDRRSVIGSICIRPSADIGREAALAWQGFLHVLFK